MGKQDEEIEQSKVAPIDNYTIKMPARSASKRAAASGDNAAAGTSNQMRLPAIELSSEHAFEQEAQLRERAEGYVRSRHTSGTAAYRNMTDQAAGYQADGLRMQLAGAAYNQLVPYASFAIDSVVRFRSIQAALGPAFADGGEGTHSLGARLETTVHDRAPQLAKAADTSGMDTAQGLVTDAGASFQSAQAELTVAYHEMQNTSLGKVISELQAEKSEKEEDREKIKETIEAAKAVVEGISGVLSFGASTVVAWKKAHPKLESGGGGHETAQKPAEKKSEDHEPHESGGEGNLELLASKPAEGFESVYEPTG